MLPNSDDSVLQACAKFYEQSGVKSLQGISVEVLARAPGVKVYDSCDDGLTGPEAVVAFNAGLRVKALLAADDNNASVADAIEGACSSDAHAESCLALVLAAAKMPRGQNGRAMPTIVHHFLQLKSAQLEPLRVPFNKTRSYPSQVQNYAELSAQLNPPL